MSTSTDKTVADRSMGFGLKALNRLAGSDLLDKPSLVVQKRSAAELRPDPNRASRPARDRRRILRRPEIVDRDQPERDGLAERRDSGVRVRSAGLVAARAAAPGDEGCEREGQGGASPPQCFGSAHVTFRIPPPSSLMTQNAHRGFAG